MLTDDHKNQLATLAGQMAPAQKLQAISLLAGNDPGRAPVALPETAAPSIIPSLPISVYYGTESGNAEILADETKKRFSAAGFAPTVKNLADHTPADLANDDHLVVIISTWGDGDPPDAILDFHARLMSEASDGIDLKDTRFSICALGDTSYEQFCETGKQVDARLETLGGTRITDREDCDVDYDAPFDAWIARVIEALETARPKLPPSTQLTVQQEQSPATAAPSVVAETTASAAASAYNRRNPFPAPLSERVLLNGTGSAKETLHFEFSLAGSGLQYQPGDALAVLPRNHDAVVKEIIDASTLDAEAEVIIEGVNKPLREALAADLDCTALGKNILKKWNEVAESPKLASLLDDSEALKDYLHGRQIVDMIEDFPAKDLSAQEFVSILRKIPPRLYSIASSQSAHPDEVHLTVAAVRYHSQGRDRTGVASTYLADNVTPGEKVPVYLHHNKNFKLPTDPTAPVIMVGPGTGIAPFRAFLEERAATSADGPCWLFFGDQHYTTDFLYQLELQQFLENGTLDRLDLAFSRDQKNKVYVQQRMLERGAEIFRWLEEGASFYVCGDAQRMAGDVHEALIEIVAAHGNRPKSSAGAYLDRLKKMRRYQRDVY